MGSIIEDLNNRAIKDDYLYEILVKLEINFGKKMFNLEYNEITEEEFFDILRFSDILSRSEKAFNRNIALKIISLLYDKYKEDEIYQYFSKNVLVKLGNFPSLNYIQDNSKSITSEEIELDKIFKQYFHRTSVNGNYFTDTQYKTFNNLKNSNHYSFSATTSFGKSFMLTEYIKWLIKEKNGSENIAFLVPTRALINQVAFDIKKSILSENSNEIFSKYKVICYPEIPKIFSNNRFIFVFTPERLISFFSNSNNIPLSSLIIDEAQNIISDDERSPTFYHAVTLAKQKSINLYFSSPNIPNPEIFLELVGNSKNESIAIDDLNVIQNKYFIDFIAYKIRIYHDYASEDKQFSEFSINSSLEFDDMLHSITNANQSIIYCNSIKHTVNLAHRIAKNMPDTDNKELDNLSHYIKKNINENYLLAKIIKKGVAFHFGPLPQTLREKIEESFKDGNIKYLFTTSTLLQGVNLPAKNLFIMSDKIGRAHMKNIEFRNLAGRAGRLSSELYGNVFVIRENENNWEEKTQKLLNYSSIPKASSQVITGNKNFYKNIGRIIKGENLTNQSTSRWKKRQLATYSTILAFQKRINTPTQLVKKFDEMNSESNKITKLIYEYEIPDDILMESINIKPEYQQNVRNQEIYYEFNRTPNYNECLNIMHILYKLYNWEEEDQTTLGNKARLGYYAFLMSEWISSKPLNHIIKNTLNWMNTSKHHLLINNNPSNTVVFDINDNLHINQVINELMKDIENIIRYQVKNYITNYLKLTNQEDNDFGKYLEYGSNKNFVIELQKIGLERSIAIYIEKYYKHHFKIDENGEIFSVDFNKLLDEKDMNEDIKKQIQLL